MEEALKCLKALADENRARIVMLLREEELSVCELMAVLRISQPLVSRHLAILRERRLVRNRRDGKLHYYSLSDEARRGGKVGFISLLSDALRGDETVSGDRKRLAELRKYMKKTGKRDMESLSRFAALKAGA